MLLTSVVILFFACSSTAQVGPNTTIAPITIQPIPTLPTTTTAGPVTPNTTASTTTIPTTPTTTTKSTTTTTLKPTTITPKSTTTTTTTTTAPPTPKPDHKLTVNTYVGNYTGTAKICLMATMAVQLELMANGVNESATWVNVTSAPEYMVNCSGKDKESLSISWAGFNGTNNTIVFGFFKNNSDYGLEYINTTININGTNVTMHHNNTEFKVPEKLSYFCAKDQALNLTDVSNKTMAKVHLISLQYQAFMNSSTEKYSSVWDCDGTNTSDVVPIVVGCVLAVLVVLVLAVYLFGRRRCQTRGYLSM